MRARHVEVTHPGVNAEVAPIRQRHIHTEAVAPESGLLLNQRHGDASLHQNERGPQASGAPTDNRYMCHVQVLVQAVTGDDTPDAEGAMRAGGKTADLLPFARARQYHLSGMH